MSTFTGDGLYQRAAQLKLSGAGTQGSAVFSYKVYKKHPRAARAFYAEIARVALACVPGKAHRALDRLVCRCPGTHVDTCIYASGHAGLQMVRHYTMNIDGLSGSACSKSQEALSPHVIEMHGNVTRLVCPVCGYKGAAQKHQLLRMTQRKDVVCPNRSKAHPADSVMRFGMLLYDDEEAEYLIATSTILHLMQSDAARIDAVVWIGVSFMQSATVGYFRELELHARSAHPLTHIICNPDEDCVWNLLSALHDPDSVLERLVFFQESAEQLIPNLLQSVCTCVGSPRTGEHDP
ncbi:hypothetical protein FVE85_3113 [Porphyridium purpureum]|uniref:Deacetylase sirtuin-type domain-containing protein n=1 Tax=Porphyridium purpureum TaxID=35688 RepID=A0A5J4YVJ0_PORPP|nr:hypothetical protein FVE85_3113 [Porphyridium purpureum]|eukprot:POR5107..scf227_4